MFQMQEPISNGPPAVDPKSSAVYVGSRTGTKGPGGYLYAINMFTGQLLWKFDGQSGSQGGAVMGSTVIGDTVYSTGHTEYDWPNVAGFLYAIDTDTGALKWNFTTDVANGWTYAAPSVVQGGSGPVAYFGSGSYVFAVDATNGSLVWKRETGGQVSAGLAVAAGMVYVSTKNDDRNVLAIDMASGEIKWTYKMDDIPFRPPTVAAGLVYVTSQDRYLYAIDASDGSFRWKFWTNATVTPQWHGPSGPMVFYEPTVGPTAYLLGGDEMRYLYAVNASSGTLLWNREIGDGNFTYYTNIAEAAGTLYVGNSEEYVYAINALKGTPLWKFKANGGVRDVISVVAGASGDPGTLYAGIQDDSTSLGCLYAVHTA